MILKTLLYAIPAAVSILICLALILMANRSFDALWVFLAIVVSWPLSLIVPIVFCVKRQLKNAFIGFGLTLFGIPLFSALLMTAIIFVSSPETRQKMRRDFVETQKDWSYKNEARVGNTLNAAKEPIHIHQQSKISKNLEFVSEKGFRRARVMNSCREVLWAKSGKYAVFIGPPNNSLQEIVCVQLSPEMVITAKANLRADCTVEMSGDELLILYPTEEQLVIAEPSDFTTRAALSVPRALWLVSHPSSDLVIVPSWNQRARVIHIPKREQVRMLEESVRIKGRNMMAGFAAYEFSEDGKYFLKTNLDSMPAFKVGPSDLEEIPTSNLPSSPRMRYWKKDRTRGGNSSSNSYRDPTFASATKFFQFENGFKYRSETGTYEFVETAALVSISPFADVAVAERSDFSFNSKVPIDEMGIYIFLPDH